MTPRLVVHLDVNETMILGDPAGGDSFADSLNKIVCKQAVVRRVEGGADRPLLERYVWADGRPLSSAGTAPALHYWEIPEGCVRFYEERELKARFAKSFCTDPASPGATYAGLHARLVAAMRRGDESEPRLVRGDSHFVIPAVWRLLEELARRRRFTLAVRTFGSDLGDVAAALQAFAERAALPALRPEALYKLRREGARVSATPLDDPTAEPLDERALVDLLERDDLPVRCVGISDDYPTWKQAAYLPTAGKPCWITPNARHVFFDDNIHNDPDDSIVDVRWLDPARGAFRQLNGSIIRRLHGLVLLRVPTLEPILHPDWFLRTLARLEADLDDLSPPRAESGP
eukprot:CAMPEP_0197409654 /NCGR_PEP_ID=MMETSP1165-20131217/30219_1 /TAXON_ID=284809 /ORGANISM="Chrysocystis fragilis, Strain CCMP3189" /LENGTH=344 /DNA_ID=CAMNT_0042936129 /DNA_START=14 /DNA_END=1044 /DNA_ORIENTATION=+